MTGNVLIVCVSLLTLHAGVIDTVCADCQRIVASYLATVSNTIAWLQTKHMQTRQAIALRPMQPQLHTSLVATALSFPIMDTCVPAHSQPGLPFESPLMGMAS